MENDISMNITKEILEQIFDTKLEDVSVEELQSLYDAIKVADEHGEFDIEL